MTSLGMMGSMSPKAKKRQLDKPRKPVVPDSEELRGALEKSNKSSAKRAIALLEQGHWYEDAEYDLTLALPQLPPEPAAELLSAALPWFSLKDLSCAVRIGNVNNLCTKLVNEGHVSVMNKLAAQLVRSSDHWLYSYYFGWALMKADEHAAALDEFDSSLAAFETSEANNNRAVCLQKLGRFEEAKEAAMRAVKLKRNNGLAHWTLANVRAELGDKRGFYKSIETALSKGCEVWTDLHPRYQDEPKLQELIAKHREA